jgi:hypothetical protein
MNDALFPDFRDAPRVYEQSVKFWREDVWRIIPEDSRRGWETPWFARQASGLEDGNPIFSAWSPAVRRGLQVIQVQPGESDNDLTWWMDFFGGEATDPNAIAKLVIVCVPSHSKVARLRSLIDEWTREGWVSEEREGFELTDTAADAYERRTAACAV